LHVDDARWYALKLASWAIASGRYPDKSHFQAAMGEVGCMRADFSTSVENEWLCAKIVEAYGLPVADCDIARFGRHKVLVVKRFDRRWMSTGWYARLPQEDFCQVAGISSSQKYEEKGGPGMDYIWDRLRGSVHPARDRERFLTVQLISGCWAHPAATRRISAFIYCRAVGLS
jgi:serine/threonine-protein kinase HipA